MGGAAQARVRLMSPHSSVRGILCVAVLWCGWAAGQEDQHEVPIIKQINRVNEDGTYTFGYEAADGSFKIETRDVLGNVKGMFGFIDENGELKRVSYSASNGTGFQATGNIGRDVSTRRPLLVYRGLGRSTTTRREPVTSTTPAYGDYINGRRGYEVTSTTEEPARPLKVLVTRRPLEKNLNLIRRQSDRERDRDTQDVYSGGRRFRYPQTIVPDPREVYRNMLLEQNNLKPEYSRAEYSRVRYYPEEDDYPDVPAVVPMVDRVIGNRYLSRYRADDLPPQIPVTDRRYPPRFPRPYDDYPPQQIDYEALREEIMNYLIQYLQVRRRMNPYQLYPGDFGRQGRLPYYQRPLPPPLGPGVPIPVPYSPQLSLPYINPNVQYAGGQDKGQDDMSRLKTRMDQADHSDAGDTRPPASSLIRMLLARPSTQRPAIRSVEILPSLSTSTPTTSTTQQPDQMESSS